MTRFDSKNAQKIDCQYSCSFSEFKWNCIPCFIRLFSYLAKLCNFNRNNLVIWICF